MSFCRAFSFLYGVQVLGHREADPATIFLQTDLALRAKVAQKWSLGKGWDPSDSETFPDMNGKLCHLCGMPLPERSDRNYVQRTDCGNHSVFEHPEVWYKPIFQFNKEDSPAFCELNYQKVCADAIVNRDWLYMAKSIDIRKSYGTTYDPVYCKLNGWLSPALKAVQHDFDGMKLKAEEFCSSQDQQRIMNMTFMSADQNYWQGYNRGVPTPEEALDVALWNCAMGTAACDMTYCAYTFCEMNGTIGTYEECEGWDPIKGMPF